MKNKLILLVGIVVAAVLLSYMLLFQVRFDEVAVRASFGKADEASVITEPGLRFRLPWPFQQVHRYTKRTQVLEVGDTTVQTADSYAVIVRFYLAWKVADPLKFYRTLKDESRAADTLATLLRSSQKVGEFRFNELVSTQQIKLNEIETLTADAIRAELDKPTADYGIDLVHVGIRRVVLEETVTEKVFERMESNRKSLAADVRTRGVSDARNIESQAEAVRSSILAFAQKYAAAIKARGKTQAAEEYKVFEENPEFGIFLRQLEALEQIFSQGHSNIFLDAGKLSRYNPIRFFLEEPDAATLIPLRPAADTDADAGDTTDGDSTDKPAGQ